MRGLYKMSYNGWVLPMVAQLKTKFKIQTDMDTKNETQKNDFNATIGNTVLAVRSFLH